MSENPKDPFEKHINGENFDVSRLDNPVPRSEMDVEMEAFFDNLPLPLNHEIWDTELDERQKALCAHLTTELVERVMRENFAELLQDLSDEQLIYILNVPVTLAMLLEQRLHQEKEEAPELISAQNPSNHPNISADLFPTKENSFGHWFSQAKDFFIRLFRRS